MNIDPKSVYPLQHFVAIAPKSITFEPAPGAGYNLTNFPGQPDANVEVASNAGLGQSLAFKLSDEGTLAAPADENGQGGATLREVLTVLVADLVLRSMLHPRLRQYQWWILGGIRGRSDLSADSSLPRASNPRIVRRAPQGKPLATYEEDEDIYEPAPVAAARESDRSSGCQTGYPRRSGTLVTPDSMLLEGLKEELFELEVEHKQGQISQQEYEKTKAALDQTLQRALKRESQKA